VQKFLETWMEDCDDDNDAQYREIRKGRPRTHAKRTRFLTHLTTFLSLVIQIASTFKFARRFCFHLQPGKFISTCIFFSCLCKCLVRIRSPDLFLYHIHGSSVTTRLLPTPRREGSLSSKSLNLIVETSSLVHLQSRSTKLSSPLRCIFISL
jgi:hypothetical protein